jgi:pimeloyl-ACP methyl ester carboxylesterase
MLKWTMLTAALLAIAAGLLMLAALTLGSPRRPAPLDSINTPFAHVDYSALPALRHYTARDGATLAWRHYAPAAPESGRRVVLVHGSAGHSASMHVLAQALAQAGFTVAALDMRGHGSSGTHGQIGYIGQLEHDVEDFVRAEPHVGPQTLLGFSSGGGFTLRFAASGHSALFDRYVLLAPFLHQDAPTAQPVDAPWVDVGLPRLLALMALNGLGITRWNHLPVMAFAVTDLPQAQLTPEYAYALALNFRPHEDYQDDIRRTAGRIRVVIGTDDELFDAHAYRLLFAPAPVETVPGTGHIGLILQPSGIQAAVRACIG